MAYGLYNYGVSHAPAAKAAAFINLIPVFACLLSWLVLVGRNAGQLHRPAASWPLAAWRLSARPARKEARRTGSQ
ncbi:MAG: EamA family transporter [Solidesulfovibrio sp.]